MNETTRQLLCALALLWVAGGCAGSEHFGVRQGWGSVSVEALALVEPYMISPMGFDDEQRAAIAVTVAEAARAELGRYRVDVSSPAELRQGLEAKERWGQFEDAAISTRPLMSLFEPPQDGAPLPAEIVAIRALGADDSLRAPLLIIEIIYHSEGLCREVAPSHRTTTIAPEGGRVPPTPCVVTHLRAKLVDPRRAETIWYNRRLRELHISKLDPSHSTQNIQAAVTLLLSQDGGLSTLLKPR